MNKIELMKQLHISSDKKIVLLVIDGLEVFRETMERPSLRLQTPQTWISLQQIQF